MNTDTHAVKSGLTPHPEIKNIIAVASGKGGVGKSTTSVNLALALKSLGHTVGLLDADIYGPNQPHMLGVREKPATEDGKILEPVMAHGLQTMSIGYLIDPESPVIWRGPMVTKMLQQLMNGTHWQKLDYLIIDLPPGTGDVQLTLSQKIPVSGAVVVTTPQDIALLDVEKAVGMFNKVGVPIVGLVENMATHICEQCGHQEAIFGEQGASQLAAVHKLEVLGQLPLNRKIREQADSGVPIFVSDPTSEVAKIYLSIAKRLLERLSLSPKDYSRHFTNVIVEKK